jgi:uncharacterized protein
MDYANRQRLKIYVRIEVLEAKDAPELMAKLENSDYKAKVERALILHIEAFDWNCPQHIMQRFTMDEIKQMIAPMFEHIAKLEAEIKELKNKND